MSFKSASKWVVVIAVVAGIIGTSAHAQEDREGIGISPTTFDISADPGQSTAGKLTVINEGTKALRYRLYVRDFGVRNEEYEKDFEPIQGEESPVDWFNLPGSVRSLEPGKQESVSYSVAIPDNAIPKGYYAVIFAETIAADEADVTGVARIKRVGSLVYLTVNGGSISKGTFLSFETPFWHRKQPGQAAVRIQNEGNVHFDATGEVRIRDVLGRTVHTAPINGTILPSTIRKFTLGLPANSPFGLYKIDGNVKFLDQAIQLGPKWILAASPTWLAIIAGIVGAWIIMLGLRIRRRAGKKK